MLAMLSPLVFDSALRTLRPKARLAALVCLAVGAVDAAVGAAGAAASLLCAYALRDARTISAPPTILIAVNAFIQLSPVVMNTTIPGWGRCSAPAVLRD